MNLLLNSLTLMFLLRVAAQFLQWAAPVTSLPAFDAFHGDVLPYPFLLSSQLAILALMVFINRAVFSGWRPARPTRHWLLAIGGLYFLAMLFRWLAGVFEWTDHEWFDRPIPAFFHLVLASYMIRLGWPVNEKQKQEAPR